ncbi:hypothetical protein [Bradyrhizobium sp. AUGA SZCCT0431]|uniref:hypothetical protein n=1 Tax=Bradyrhizobium sp. AUGA SZCCT0431 TaxID=2807674 RepID=UPI001BA571FA|nr:hypothetical protein [Bradyrhizobium sp. AUGA SZCCT0431]MBR1142499.1 hypothetical protein [Bradyrhizobium sp. AUGA SZCCT0431]
MFRNAGRLIALLAPVGTALACFLLSSDTAWAADYSVDYGVDTVNAGKDAGTVACQLKQTCKAKIESLELNVSFSLSWKSGEAIVKLENDDLTCCYFSGGGRSVIVNAHTKLSRLPFFKGTAPRGGLFIQNEPAGILYLRFDLQ